MEVATSTTASYPPLTTIFTPAPECSSIVSFTCEGTFCRASAYANYAGCTTSVPRCYPVSELSYQTDGLPISYGLYSYSPAYFCPFGWETAGWARDPDGALCCPTDYYFHTSSQACIRTINGTTGMYTANGCVGTTSRHSLEKQFSILQPYAGIFDVELWAREILLVGSTPTNATSSTSTVVATTSMLGPASGTSRSNGTTDDLFSPGEQSVHNTSRQTIIGVIIGATCGGILLISAGYFLVRNYRRKRRSIEVKAPTQQLEEGYNEYGMDKPELEGSCPPPTQFIKSELDANATRAELEGHTIEEMDGVGVVAELEG